MHRLNARKRKATFITSHWVSTNTAAPFFMSKKFLESRLREQHAPLPSLYTAAVRLGTWPQNCKSFMYTVSVSRIYTASTFPHSSLLLAVWICLEGLSAGLCSIPINSIYGRYNNLAVCLRVLSRDFLVVSLILVQSCCNIRFIASRFSQICQSASSLSARLACSASQITRFCVTCCGVVSSVQLNCAFNPKIEPATLCALTL